MRYTLSPVLNQNHASAENDAVTIIAPITVSIRFMSSAMHVA